MNTHPATISFHGGSRRWRDFGGAVVAEIIADGDVVPVRADYASQQAILGVSTPQQWSIGVNPLHGGQLFWYSLPDLIASKIQTGQVPTIVRAVRFVPAAGSQPGLRPVALQGLINIDPRRDDFFQRVVEARQETPRLSASVEGTGPIAALNGSVVGQHEPT